MFLKFSVNIFMSFCVIKLVSVCVFFRPNINWFFLKIFFRKDALRYNFISLVQFGYITNGLDWYSLIFFLTAIRKYKFRRNSWCVISSESICLKLEIFSFLPERDLVWAINAKSSYTACQFFHAFQQLFESCFLGISIYECVW